MVAIATKRVGNWKSHYYFKILEGEWTRRDAPETNLDA